MSKQAKELSALEVKRLTDPGLHAVGGVAGLYLQVLPKGGRTWILRVTVGKKRRHIGLGGFPTVTLEQARKAARQAREDIRNGIDPVQAKEAAQEALKASQDSQLTFEEAARKRHQKKSPEFKSQKHANDWIKSLEQWVFPHIGRRNVDTLTKRDILDVLTQPVEDGTFWSKRTETATRVRQRMDLVFHWAIANGYRSKLSPAEWKGMLAEDLPAPTKIAKSHNFPALYYGDLPEFMKALRQKEGAGAKALEFLILTAARSGEVRQAKWDEIDFRRNLWIIPGERMKTGKEHRVPLSDAAVTLLESLPRISDYIFPNTKGKPISDMTISAVCRRMEVDAVPHGFRSSFKEWAREATSYPDEVSEIALAHRDADKVRQAYARGDRLNERTMMMNEWAVFLGCQQRKTGLKEVSA